MNVLCPEGSRLQGLGRAPLPGGPHRLSVLDFQGTLSPRGATAETHYTDVKCRSKRLWKNFFDAPKIPGKTVP